MKKRTVVWLVVAVVIAIAGYFLYRGMQDRRAAAQSQYQTTEVDMGSLTAIVGATGTVRANQSAVMTWQTTGQIDDIFVEIDDEVTPGTVLAELAPHSLPQNIILAQSELYNARQALIDLQNYELAAAQAKLALENSVEALEKAQNSRESKDYQRASDETIETARANYLLAQNEVDRTEQIYDLVDNRPEDDPERLAAFSAWMAARQQRDRAYANYNYLLGDPDANEISLADANLALAQAQFEDAQRNYEDLKEGPSPDQIAAAEARIQAAEATLGLTRLEAPFAGMITQVLSLPGDQVAPGTASIRIDDLSRLLVDVEIPEVDINSVQVGQTATLSFDAVLDREYTGTVVEVARVGTIVQGTVNFRVTIELTDPDETVLPGMTAAVNIVVNQIDDVLLVPNRAVRLRDGQRVVYVLQNGALEQVNIEIGATSEVYSEVLSGDLEPGDTVVLNPPTQFNMGGGMFGP